MKMKISTVYEDENFGRQDYILFFSEKSKDYEYIKSPQTLYAYITVHDAMFRHSNLVSSSEVIIVRISSIFMPSKNDNDII